jgi:putative addiction module component (TIGR02574 family)
MKIHRGKTNGLDLDDGENAAIEAAWAAEIEKRIAEVESGEAKISTWEEAHTRIRAALATS